MASREAHEEIDKMMLHLEQVAAGLIPEVHHRPLRSRSPRDAMASPGSFPLSGSPPKRPLKSSPDHPTPNTDHPLGGP